MLDDMPLEVFHEWIAYNECSPIGEWRADHRAAMVACTMANVMRGKKGRRARMKDFMPQFGPKVGRRQSPAEMKANIMMFAAQYQAHGGKIRKGKCRQ